jgi:hypothetical protein
MGCSRKLIRFDPAAELRGKDKTETAPADLTAVPTTSTVVAALITINTPTTRANHINAPVAEKPMFSSYSVVAAVPVPKSQPKPTPAPAAKRTKKTPVVVTKGLVSDVVREPRETKHKPRYSF